MRALASFCLLLAAAPCVRPQSFEVASIKPNNSGSGHSGTHTYDGGMRMENVSLKQCVEMAYDVKDYSLSAPDWLDSVHFDILAKVPEGAKKDEFGPMMQALLKERFQLAAHRESKVLSAYALAVAKGGPKVKAVEGGKGSSMNTNNSHLTAKNVTMERLADYLARRTDRPVVDQTELKGAFDFTLQWTPDESKSTSADSGPSLFTALQEQLGLRLQPHKLPVDILVVDHVERVPTAN